MSSFDDPLAKPTWPVTEPAIQEAVVSQLITLQASARTDTSAVVLGFNAVMAALEAQFSGGPPLAALFVARDDISGLVAMPLSLASAAGRIRLVTLPKGSKQRLDGADVIGLWAHADAPLLAKLVNDVGYAQTSWTYVGPTSTKPPKKAKTPKKAKAPIQSNKLHN